MRSGWEYRAGGLDGAGGATAVAHVLPLVDVSITLNLSGPPTLTGQVPPGTGWVPVAWSSIVYASHDGDLVGGFVVHAPATETEDGRVEITCTGLSGYADGMPWTGPPRPERYDVDAGSALKWVWDHLQSQPGGDIGLRAPDVQTGVTVGRQAEVTGDDGGTGGQDDPFILSRDQARDLGATITDLVGAGLQWRERVRVTPTGSPLHWLDVGGPGSPVGTDLTGTVLHAGVHLEDEVRVDLELDTPTGVLVIGPAPQDAGGGQGVPPTGLAESPPQGRLRRVAVVDDSGVDHPAAAQAAAARRLSEAGVWRVAEVRLRHTPAVPVTSVLPGDRVAVAGPTRAGHPLTVYGRVLQVTYDDTDTATLHLTQDDERASP